MDQHILNESNTRRENLAMVWIDHKKACDKTLKPKPYQSNKYLGCTSRKIFWTLSKVDGKKKNKKTNYHALGIIS